MRNSIISRPSAGVRKRPARSAPRARPVRAPTRAAAAPDSIADALRGTALVLDAAKVAELSKRFHSRDALLRTLASGLVLPGVVAAAEAASGRIYLGRALQLAAEHEGAVDLSPTQFVVASARDSEGTALSTLAVAQKLRRTDLLLLRALAPRARLLVGAQPAGSVRSGALDSPAEQAGASRRAGRRELHFKALTPDPLAWRAHRAATESWVPRTHAYAGAVLQVRARGKTTFFSGSALEDASGEVNVGPVEAALASLVAHGFAPHDVTSVVVAERVDAARSSTDAALQLLRQQSRALRHPGAVRVLGLTPG